VRLAERLSEAAPGLHQSFVCAGTTSQQTPGIAFPVTNLAGAFERATRLRECLACDDGFPAVIYLHYVGYGYAPRGAPVWLPRVLRDVLEQRPGTRLFTMFHELYACGFPWRSSFWLEPVQRRVARVLARLSHGVFTNQRTAAIWLNNQTLSRPAVYAPTCSSVGEPEQLVPWRGREPVAAIFGGVGIRELIYRLPDDTLRMAFDRGGIERVWDIGPPTPHQRPLLAGRGVTRFGVLPRDEVSMRLGAVRLGLLSYPVRVLTKSSVAAAYLAHAVPILLTQWEDSNDKYEGPAYLSQEGGDESMCADVAMQGFRWYRKYAHSTLAARYVLRAIRAHHGSFVQQECSPGIAPCIDRAKS
jgi:hypothetical protein